MFCQNCGNHMADQAKFCSKCGRPIQQASSGDLSGWRDVDGYGQISDVIPEVRKKKFPVFAVRAIGLLVVAVFVIVLLLIPLSFTFSKLWIRPYEGPVRNMVEGIDKKDGNLFLSSMIPGDVMDKILEASGYDEDKLMEEMDRQLEKETFRLFSDTYNNLNENLNSLDELDYKISYKIDKVTTMKKSELRNIENMWDMMDIDMVVTMGKHLDLILTTKMTGGKFKGEKVNEKISVDVIQIDGKWYIDVLSFLEMYS